jgi:hypothetical protein
MAERVTERAMDLVDIDRIEEGSACAGEMGNPPGGIV